MIFAPTVGFSFLKIWSKTPRIGKKYQCRRKEKDQIKVLVKYSPRSYEKLHNSTTTKSAENENQTPTTVPIKVQNMVSQWRSRDKKSTELSNKKRHVAMLSNKFNELRESLKNTQQKVIQATSEIEKSTKSHEETVQKMQRKQYYLSKQNK